MGPIQLAQRLKRADLNTLVAALDRPVRQWTIGELELGVSVCVAILRDAPGVPLELSLQALLDLMSAMVDKKPEMRLSPSWRDYLRYNFRAVASVADAAQPNEEREAVELNGRPA